MRWFRVTKSLLILGWVTIFCYACSEIFYDQDLNISPTIKADPPTPSSETIVHDVYTPFPTPKTNTIDVDPSTPRPETNVLNIPKQSEWTNHGIVLTAGPVGSWDVRLHGQISPSTMVKKNGIYYLYYIGADGDRSTDGGPRHRAIGVATSTDGIHFSKYEGNPIITYLPQNNEEEGVFSAAATLDANGDILLYFGGMIAKNQSSTTVSSDILLAISSDGLTFHNPGIVISHADKSVWGRGDELFPLGIYEQNGIRYLYYIAKGIGAQWDLGLALGIDRKTFSDSQPILEKGDDIIGGNVVHAGDGEIFLFLVRDFEQGRIEVRRSDPTSSGQLSPAMDTYDFGNNWRHATVYLDSESSTWFMYHRPRGGNEIYVRTAGLVLNEYEQ